MIQITTVVENSPGTHNALIAEYGLSFFIDTGRDALLFDTGRTGLLVPNALRLALDLKRVRRVVLSHGHFDHSGGIRALVEQNADFELVTGKGFFEPKYATMGVAYEYVGNDFDADWLSEHGIAHQSVDMPVWEVVPGVHALTDFPRIHSDEVVNPRFKLRVDGGWADDPFADEVMLAVETPKGLVAVVGCSHPGIKNMLDAVSERLNQPIYAVIGGTHLMEASSDRIGVTLDYFRQKDIKIIGASHCTGSEAVERIRQVFGERYYANSTGAALFFD